MDDFGLEVGARLAVMMGRRYGGMGTYISVCVERWMSERRMCKWKGNERELGINL